jgi:hypothetical protein
MDVILAVWEQVVFGLTARAVRLGVVDSQVHRVVRTGNGRRCVMDNGLNLKKRGMARKMAQYPGGTALGALVSAGLCGVLGSAHGETVAVVMAVLGAIIGAPMAAMLAASSHNDVS